MAATGQTWLLDVLYESALYTVLFILIWKSSTADFNVCDGVSTFGTSKSADELQDLISSDHNMGERCVPSTKLVDAGLTRELSSQCLDSAYHSYLGHVVTVLVSVSLCLASSAINDLVLWRTTDSDAKRCRLYTLMPMTLIGAVCAAVFTGNLIRLSANGWTCKTNDDAAWVYVTVGGGLAVPKLGLVMALMFLRLSNQLFATLRSMGDGQPRLMLHRPAWTRSQVRGAYMHGDGLSNQDELDPLMGKGGPAAQKKLQEALRPWIHQFYTKNNPKKVDTVDTILESYIGHEELLFEELHHKYRGSEATAAPADAALPTFGNSDDEATKSASDGSAADAEQSV